MSSRTPTAQSRVEWERILDAFHHRCAYCGRGDVRLQREHMVPRIRGGGEELENIVPACGRCNSSKNDSTALEWFLGIDGSAFKHLGRQALLYGGRKSRSRPSVVRSAGSQPHPTASQGDSPCMACGGWWFRPILLPDSRVEAVCADCFREAIAERDGTNWRIPSGAA